MGNRAGTYRNNLKGELSYQSFVPSPLPPVPPLEKNEEMIELLMQASSAIAYLNGVSSNIPNVNLFTAMYLRKEALLSSQIEGTQASLDDILDPSIDENVNNDVADVINYIKAFDFAMKRREELPLCNRFLREIHAILLKGTRGEEKDPGFFRHSQNWIGARGCSLKDARYIPPNVEDMLNALSDLEKFINDDDKINPLIKIALIHYQFETIYPFLDGNGRIGRMLIILFLLEKKVLSTPAFYPSCYLKLNRIEYYDRLSEVRRSGSYEQWVIFFLRVLKDSAENAVDTIKKLVSLHDKNLALLKEGLSRTRFNTVFKIFSYLESCPIINANETAKTLEISYSSVKRAVNTLLDKGILSLADNKGKNQIFIYGKYLEILREGTEVL